MSSSSSEFSPANFSPPPLEQLYYVHCKFCNTVLAVSVPCSSWFKTVTVKCGHCTNLISVNMATLVTLPPPAAPKQLHHFLPPFLNLSPPSPSLLVDPVPNKNHNNFVPQVVQHNEEERQKMDTAKVIRPPEKRQRVPSAYNCFIKNEIRRIKTANPDITHREAFSAAAKNWAHFPHIQYGMMHQGTLKKSSICSHQEGDDVIFKDESYAAAAANLGVTPF